MVAAMVSQPGGDRRPEAAMSRFGVSCGGCGMVHHGGVPGAAPGDCPSGLSYRAPAAAARELPAPAPAGQLSASEALYGFAGWLTSRGERVVLSAQDDASRVAELVGEFCETNGLDAPRDGWERGLRFPRATADEPAPESSGCSCATLARLTGNEVSCSQCNPARAAEVRR